MATALKAGSAGGSAYVPVAILAAVAGYLLMEMVARITAVSGQRLGRVVGRYGRWLPPLLFSAVAFGCAAYQAGNLTGALGGLQLLLPELPRAFLPLLSLLVGVGLWLGSTDRLGRWLAGVVGLLGLVFLYGAIRIATSSGAIVAAAPLLPAVVVGLVGTTIVPYNFFLAAGLGSGSELRGMRRGLGLSFGIGAIITSAIVITGSVLDGFTGFPDAAEVIDGLLGSSGSLVLGTGLFAAGLSSALTAPLAAAMAGRELLGGDRAGWTRSGRWFRSCWVAVLLLGTAVGLLNLDITYVILTAQVVNGILIPLIAALVVVLAADRRLLGQRVSSVWQNIGGLLVVFFLTYRNVEVLGEYAGGRVQDWAWLLTLLLGGFTTWKVYSRNQV